MTKSTPDQPTGMNELNRTLTILIGAASIGNTKHNDVGVELKKAEAALQQLVERCLPNSQNGTGRVFNGNLTGAAMASGYRQAVDDIRHNLQQAGLLRGDET